MPNMNNTSAVSHQYNKPDNLSTRIALHQQYSVNPYGYHNWLYDQYELSPHETVLELGCGTGETWRGKIAALPLDVSLTLTDISAGMVETVKTAYGVHPHMVFEQMDIQNIPREDNAYDVVIANSMLYHVPDMPRALREVRRVLKPSGRFIAATMGVTHGMHAYLREALREYDDTIDVFNQSSVTFTLENGAALLRAHFKQVETRRYEDSLAITHINDLIEWLRSTIALLDMTEAQLTGLADFFEQKKDADGVLRIPKEVGVFIARD